jgi:hypothetical protein
MYYLFERFVYQGTDKEVTLVEWTLVRLEITCLERHKVRFTGKIIC